MSGATTTTRASLARTVRRPFDDVLRDVEQRLAGQGFGILTRIDVRATLKQKLGVDLPRLEILGACHPPLAHRALTRVPEIAVMLPCNVVVRELAPDETRVDAVSPQGMVEMFPGQQLADVAGEIGERLGRVLQAL